MKPSQEELDNDLKTILDELNIKYRIHDSWHNFLFKYNNENCEIDYCINDVTNHGYAADEFVKNGWWISVGFQHGTSGCGYGITRRYGRNELMEIVCKWLNIKQPEKQLTLFDFI